MSTDRYKKYRTTILISNANWRRNNRDRVNARQRDRRKNDPLFRLKRNMRHRVYKIIKRHGYVKKASSITLIGCDKETLMEHLKSKFQPGMTVENYGTWHVDHIIPLASAKTEDELLKLFHYTNLQPLWAKDNCAKGSKCTLTTQPR